MYQMGVEIVLGQMWGIQLQPMGTLWRTVVILCREGWQRGSSQITLGFLVNISRDINGGDRFRPLPRWQSHSTAALGGCRQTRLRDE